MIKKLFRFLIYTNLFVSLGSLLLTVETVLFLGLNLNKHIKILALTFFATLFLYNYQRVLGFKNETEYLQTKRHSWINKNHYFLIFVVIISAIISLYIGLTILDKKYFIFCSVLFFIAFFYSTPLFKKNNNWYRLRDLPFAKLFLVGFVWSAVVVIFPVMEEFFLFKNQKMILLFIIQLLFIIAITIPFDIRDFAIDKHNKIKTIPITLGINNAKIIAYTLTLAGLFISILFFYTDGAFWITELILSVFTIVLIKKSLPTNNDFYFTFYIDGLMILKPLIYFGLIYMKSNF